MPAKLQYDDPVDLENRIEQYFDMCVSNKRIPTRAGLAYALGFASKSTLEAYRKRMKFRKVMSRAFLHLESYLEESLLSGKNPAGPIFLMCNLYDYQQPQLIEKDRDGDGKRRKVTKVIIEGVDAEEDIVEGELVDA